MPTKTYFVRLVQGRGFNARLIEFKGSDWPSHVELLETDSYDHPIRVLGSRYPAGIAYRGYNDYPVNRDVWFKHPFTSQAWVSLEKLLGHKYDLLDIFGIGFDEDWHMDGHYICSEAVAWAFEDAGHPLFNPEEEVRRIMPVHFLLALDLVRYR